MSGCGCQTDTYSCHDGALHGFFLGAMTPEEATEQIFPQAKVRGGAGHDAKTRGYILSSAQLALSDGSGFTTAYQPGQGACAGSTGAGNLKLAQTASGLALTGVSIGLTAAGTVTAAALAPFTLGISALIGLFPLFFGHHSAAVKKENSILCAAIPAANNYLRVIDQAVHSGQVDPQHGIAALDSLVSDFQSQVSSIIHGNDPSSSGECNAACENLSELRAFVLVRKSEYQDLADAVAQTVVASRPNVTSPAGVNVPVSSYASFYGAPAAAPSTSDWLPIAALVLAGLFFLRSA